MSEKNYVARVLAWSNQYHLATSALGKIQTAVKKCTKKGEAKHRSMNTRYHLIM